MNEQRVDHTLSEATVLEAAELSRMLEEKWGAVVSADGNFESDAVQAFVLAIERYAARTLGRPEDHLTGIRSDLRRAVAA